MDWLELKIDTSHAGLDAVTDMLEQQGVTGVMIDDEADFQSFLENNRQYWDYVDDDLLAQKKGVSRVTFYLERNEDAYGTVAAVRMAMSALKKDHPEYAPLLLTMADVADEDWENNWKQFYKPMEIGSRLLVVPEWEEAADPTRVKLVLNPGLTFGTGSPPPPACACRRWIPTSTAVSGCWTWAAAAASCPSPPCAWARRAPSPATSTRSAWTWPMRTPP